MIGILRFIGLLNAAVWLGAAVSFTIAVGPAFFSTDMKVLIPPPYNGAAAQLVIQRYFILLNCCGGIALIHWIVEKLYLGRLSERFILVLLLATISLGLFGGFWLQPKLKDLHRKKYDPRSSTEVHTASDRSFKIWHGVSQTMNLFVIGGLLIYLWRIGNPADGTRFVSAQKFKT